MRLAGVVSAARGSGARAGRRRAARCRALGLDLRPPLATGLHDRRPACVVRQRRDAGADRHRLPRLRAGGTGGERRLALRPQHGRADEHDPARRRRLAPRGCARRRRGTPNAGGSLAARVPGRADTVERRDDRVRRPQLRDQQGRGHPVHRISRTPGRWTTGGNRPDQQAGGEHDDARGDRDGGRPASLRADATGVEGRPASGGDPVRRPGGLIAARPTALDRQLFRGRSTLGPRRRPVRDRRGRSCRPPRRRWCRRLLPRRDHGVRVRRGESLHLGCSRTPRRPRGRGGPQWAGTRRRRAALRPPLGLDALRRRRHHRRAS